MNAWCPCLGVVGAPPCLGVLLGRSLLVVAMDLWWMDGQGPCPGVGEPMVLGPPLGGAGLLMVYPSLLWVASPHTEASLLAAAPSCR